MSRLKNGVNKVVAFSTALLMMTGMVNSASAAWDACCPDPCCPVDCCEMPDYTIYADFIYWQVHPEGLEFAREGGISASATTDVSERGCVFTPDCEFEPGFRVGAIIDLGCCNWDFYAQYTWLCEKFGKTVSTDQVSPPSNTFVPLIYNQDGLSAVNTATGHWDNNLNVLDFGLGRTFEVNCCFDFRPHLGFKATWQELKYDVTYVRQDSTAVLTTTNIHFKTDFDGIGLRGGFDAAWRFSPCFSIVGGFAASAVYSDICTFRTDSRYVTTDGVDGSVTTNVDLKNEHCVLVPVLELLLGIRWDSRVCDCYDMFVFVGWENQVWFDLNRNIYIQNAGDDHNDIQFGPHGNVTYQGLTVRAGMGF